MSPVYPTHLDAVISKLRTIGCHIGPDRELGPHSIKVARRTALFRLVFFPLDEWTWSFM